MSVAERMLARSKPSLKTPAQRSCYRNEFTKALKREFGVAPGH
jgi:hypothetical protein